MEIYLSFHGAFQLNYHLVFCTKYRRKILNPGVVSYLKKLFPKVIEYVPGVSITTLGFDDTKPDHVHFEIIIPPKYSISEVVSILKSKSSNSLRKKFLFINKVRGYENKDCVWSVGYYVSSLGYDEIKVRKYIEWQGHQDLGQVKLNLLDSANL